MANIKEKFGQCFRFRSVWTSLKGGWNLSDVENKLISLKVIFISNSYTLNRTQYSSPIHLPAY